MRVKFFYCKSCKNIVALVNNGGIPLNCCGMPMLPLEGNTTEASQEKHIPAVQFEGDKISVKVGSTPHPMEEAHYIQWVFIETEQGGQRKLLNPGDQPEVCFSLCDGDKVHAAYAFCNLHMLWKLEL